MSTRPSLFKARLQSKTARASSLERFACEVIGDCVWQLAGNEQFASFPLRGRLRSYFVPADEVTRERTLFYVFFHEYGKSRYRGARFVLRLNIEQLLSVSQRLFGFAPGVYGPRLQLSSECVVVPIGIDGILVKAYSTEGDNHCVRFLNAKNRGAR